LKIYGKRRRSVFVPTLHLHIHEQYLYERERIQINRWIGKGYRVEVNLWLKYRSTGCKGCKYVDHPLCRPEQLLYTIQVSWPIERFSENHNEDRNSCWTDH
jgi:hypothetical protein